MLPSSEFNGFPSVKPSADDRFLIGTDNKDLFVRSRAGGNWRQLTSVESSAEGAWVCFTPTRDGQAVVYQARDAAGKQALYRISTEGGEPRRIGEAATQAPCHGLWLSPDGRQIAAVRADSIGELSLLENFVPSAKSGRVR